MLADVVHELASRLRISDPKPARCAGCYCSSDANLRFVDFDGVALDRGAVVEEGSMAVIDSIDELHLCEACVRNAAEVIEYVPGLHQRQLQELRRLNRENDQLREYTVKLERMIAERPEALD